MKSHYSDPTANTAIANVDRELRKQQKRDEQLKKAAAKSTAPAHQKKAADAYREWKSVRSKTSAALSANQRPSAGEKRWWVPQVSVLQR